MSLSILVSSAGAQNGVNVIKVLSESGEDFKIIGCDCDPMSAGLYLADKRYLVPKNNDPEFIPEILKIVEKEKIDIVIPTYSTEFPVFARNADKFKGKIVLSSSEAYELSDNKPQWMEFLGFLGMDVPRINPTEFPRIIKPITGSGSKKQYVVNSMEEVLKYRDNTNFCSEFIEGQEYVVDGMSDLDGKMICAMPRIRLQATAGGCKKARTIENAELVELAKMIVESMQLVGAWNVQCIEKDGKYYFIDINNRFPSGGLPLAVASGVNMPMMTIDLLRGKKIQPKLIYNLVMLRYDDQIIINDATLSQTDYLSD